MVSSTVLAALSALALAPAANSAILDKRPPILGSFILSTDAGCPVTIGEHTAYFIVGYGEACGNCKSVALYNSTDHFKAITNLNIDPRCTVTLFQTSDCSDPGIVSGPNCWTPEGGILAYEAACPWWPTTTDGGLKPCYT